VKPSELPGHVPTTMVDHNLEGALALVLPALLALTDDVIE
jgi:hypothetical protein